MISAVLSVSTAVRRMQSGDLAGVSAMMRATPHAPVWSEADFRALLSDHAGPGELSPVAFSESGNSRMRAAWVAVSHPGAHAREPIVVPILGFVVGSLLALPGWAECELEYIAVAPSVQSRGVGQLLLRTLVDWASTAGASTVRLEVRASNTTAIRFYERECFRQAGLRPDYYYNPDEHAVLMERGL